MEKLVALAKKKKGKHLSFALQIVAKNHQNGKSLESISRSVDIGIPLLIAVAKVFLFKTQYY